MSAHKYSTATHRDRTVEQHATRMEYVTSQAGKTIIDMCNLRQPFSVTSSNVPDSGASFRVLTALISELCTGMHVLATDLPQGMLEVIDKKELANVESKVVYANDTSGGGIEAETFSHVPSTFVIQSTNDQQQAVE